LNLYETLANVKADLDPVSATTHDAALLRYLEAASRAIDLYCYRHFFVRSETRYQTPAIPQRVILDDDLLVATTMTADSEQDGTYDGETWTEDTDFWLVPRNGWPKHSMEITEFGSYTFRGGRHNLKIVGQWGYGDGLSATPYTDSGFTGTLATTTGTTLTADSDPSATVKVGHTILIGTEQMYVSAISDTSVTVTRGVNGTTAAAHSEAAINVYKYPAPVSQMCAWLARQYFKDRRNSPEMSQERIGDYFYTRLATAVDNQQRRVLGPFVRAHVPGEVTFA